MTEKTFEELFPELWQGIHDFEYAEEEIKKHCLSKQRVRDSIKTHINGASLVPGEWGKGIQEAMTVLLSDLGLDK